MTISRMTPTANGADGDGDNNDDDQYYDDVNESFSDPDDLVELDDDTAPSAEDFPNATEEDFQDDDGTWTESPITTSPRRICSANHEYFGDTQATQLAAQGYQEFADPGFMRGMDQIVPGAANTINLYQQDGRLHAFGFIEAAALSLLMARYTGDRFQSTWM